MKKKPLKFIFNKPRYSIKPGSAPDPNIVIYLKIFMLLFSMFRRVSKNLKKNKDENKHKQRNCYKLKHMDKRINWVIEQRLSDYKKENKTKKDEIKNKKPLYIIYFIYTIIHSCLL